MEQIAKCVQKAFFLIMSPKPVIWWSVNVVRQDGQQVACSLHPVAICARKVMVELIVYHVEQEKVRRKEIFQKMKNVTI